MNEHILPDTRIRDSSSEVFCHVTLVVGKRASGKSSMLSNSISHQCLILVNTIDNAQHHTLNSRGANIILLKSPLESGDLETYCRNWNILCLLIDDSNGTSHDVILIEALNLAKTNMIKRLVISLNNPLMIPLTHILLLGCSVKIDITMLSNYDDPASMRVIQILKSLMPLCVNIPPRFCPIALLTST